MSPFRTYERLAIGTTITITVSAPRALGAVVAIARGMVDELDASASRFRPDSELTAINRRAASADVDCQVSPMLGTCIAAALHAARLTDGLCDPTVGAAVIAAGYDDDIRVVRGRDGVESRAVVPPGPGWMTVAYDAPSRGLRLVKGTCLDLGAIAKAATADMIAARIAERLDVAVVASLGGDVAIGGPFPSGGWPIAVADAHGCVLQTVRSDGQAFTTSSTQKRHGAAATVVPTTSSIRDGGFPPRSSGVRSPVPPPVRSRRTRRPPPPSCSAATPPRGLSAPGWPPAWTASTAMSSPRAAGRRRRRTFGCVRRQRRAPTSSGAAAAHRARTRLTTGR